MGCSSCRSMERHNLCFFQFASERRSSRMSCGFSSPVGVEARRKSPCSCSRRRSKQVNLVFGRCNRPWGKSPKLCGSFDDESNRSVFRCMSPPETRMSCRATTGVSVVLLTSGKPAVEPANRAPWCMIMITRKKLVWRLHEY